MLALHPNIAIYTPEVLETTIEALADSLQLQRLEVLTVVKHQPLYLVQPHLAKQNLLAYPDVLATPLPDVIRALRSCPGALALDPTALQQHLSSISRTFALSEPEAVQAVLQQPQLLQYPPPQLQQRMDQLQELLHHQPLAAQQLALKLPSALDLQPGSTTASLHLIQDCLAATELEAVAVAVACPRLLLLEATQLQMLVAQASSVFVALLGRQGALRALVARGELLQLPASVLHNKWQLLEGLCGSSPAWGQELRGLAAGEVAELMVQDYRCMARLRWGAGGAVGWVVLHVPGVLLWLACVASAQGAGTAAVSDPVHRCMVPAAPLPLPAVPAGRHGSSPCTQPYLDERLRWCLLCLQVLGGHGPAVAVPSGRRPPGQRGPLQPAVPRLPGLAQELRGGVLQCCTIIGE